MTDADADARGILAAELKVTGPSWAALSDAIASDAHYENDTLHVAIALRAIAIALRQPAAEADADAIAGVVRAGNALIANLNGYAARLATDTIDATRELHNALAALNRADNAEGGLDLLDEGGAG